MRHPPVAAWIDRRRVLWCGALLAALSVAELTRYVADHLTLGLMPPGEVQLGDDFIIFWLGARLTLAGHAAQVYDTRLFYSLQQWVIGPAAAWKFCPYPPVMLLLCAPLGLLSFVPALAAWMLVGAALCAWLLARLVGWPLALLATIGAPAAFLNIASGQNGFYTAATLAGGLMLLERRPAGAGLCFGILCYKPHLAVLLPIALAAGGYWRTLLVAGVTAGLLTAGSLLLFGVDTWAAALHQMALQRELLEGHQNLWCSRVPTVFSALRQVGAPVAWSYAGQILSALVAAAAIARVWRRGTAMALKAATLIVAGFLASPYAWDYDMVALLFAVAWLAADAARTPLAPAERLVAILLLALPALMILIELALPVQIGPIALWLAFSAIIRRCFADGSGGHDHGLPNHIARISL